LELNSRALANCLAKSILTSQNAFPVIVK